MPYRVHIYPTLPRGEDPGDGGIRQVVRAQYRVLPTLGWEIEEDPAKADLIACHAEIPSTYLKLYPHKPFVVMNHGAYWTEYDWNALWCYQSNANGLAAIRAADATVTVSEWVANALRRHTARDVRVVYHGVDMEEWAPADQKPATPYVLWNKTRVDPVCDIGPVNALARRMPDVRFVSTFGDALPNMVLTDRQPFEQAKSLVKGAAVYLCTTRETFGIGTLEAMAAGVPIVGYRWGGQVEIVRDGIDGILVTPNDVAALEAATREVLARRDEFGAHARERATEFSWERAGAQYVQLFEELVARKTAKRPKVSVIVPAYNLAQFLPDTLRSIQAQTLDDWECIVVDDASPDACGEIAEEFARADPRFRVIHNETNQYLARARNIGIEAARGEYVFPLDADDMIHPRTLALLADALDQDRSIHVAYGGVLFVEADGQKPITYRGHERDAGHSGWPVDFDLEWQLRGPGQLLPYASMYRREVWERSGGYRGRARSSEDCDFWLRTTSYGFVPKMVTKSDTLIYRVREDSMSSAKGEGWEEHRSWYPWVQDRTLLPAGAVRDVPVGSIAYPALDPPVIAVVIPVGPGHGKYVHDAVDSVDAQTFRSWECIVVNDSGEPLPHLPSWVKVVEPEDGTHRFGGVARARNAGIRASRAPLFVPLDADDLLQSRALQLLFDAHRDSGECRSVVYSDWWDETALGKFSRYEADDYSHQIMDGRKRRVMGEQREGAVYAVTALYPKAYWREVGGFDESLPAWEDWAFQIALAAKRKCARRVPAPLWTYRKFTGQRRESNYATFEESVRGIMQKDFGLTREGFMACSTCGGSTRSYGGANMRSAPADGAVLLEYMGTKGGGVTFRGERSGRQYRFSASHRLNYVAAEDADAFLRRSDFRRAELAGSDLRAAQTPQPEMVASRAYGFQPPQTAPTPDPVAAVLAAAPVAVADAPLAQPDAVPDAPQGDPEDVGETQPMVGAEATVKQVLDRFPSRSALNAEAKRMGVASPEALPNKTAVANAIVTMREIRGA